MNIRVVYHSGRSGNTTKVAEAIAEACGTKAEKIAKGKMDFHEPIDLLFVGSGIYFHKPHRTVRALIKRLKPVNVKSAATFGTYGNQSEIGTQITELLQKQDISVLGDPFVCKGDSPGTDNKGHPDKTDLANAKEFAKNVVAMLG